MTAIEKEQLTNAIETKAGILRNRYADDEQPEEVSELLEIVEDAKVNGTSYTEAKCLLEDLELALV